MNVPDDKQGVVEVKRDHKGEWRWSKKARNGEIIADSAEGYNDQSYAIKMATEEAGTDYVVHVHTTDE